jgi:type I restriction enzyme M protein
VAVPGNIQNHAAFIWSVADLLRGDYKQSEYGKVILPLTVLRRLDCVLEPTKAQVLDRYEQLRGRVENLDPVLQRTAGEQFYNTSRYDFGKLLAAPDDLADNLRHYIASFSPGARDVLDQFDFDTQIGRLARSNLLYLVVSKFAEIDLHPDAVSNLEMGYLYEELIRRFSELSNETAGEHFTPREVIRLMVNLLFIEDEDLLTKPGIVTTMLDPACGTGGMIDFAACRRMTSCSKASRPRATSCAASPQRVRMSSRRRRGSFTGAERPRRRCAASGREQT